MNTNSKRFLFTYNIIPIRHNILEILCAYREVLILRVLHIFIVDNKDGGKKYRGQHNVK